MSKQSDFNILVKMMKMSTYDRLWEGNGGRQNLGLIVGTDKVLCDTHLNLHLLMFLMSVYPHSLETS